MGRLDAFSERLAMLVREISDAVSRLQVMNRSDAALARAFDEA